MLYETESGAIINLTHLVSISECTPDGIHTARMSDGSEFALTEAEVLGNLQSIINR